MSEWPSIPLVELVQDGQISYGVVQPGNDTGGGVPIVRVKDVRNGIVDASSPIRVAREIAEKYSRTTLIGGELLLSLVGTVGESAVAPDALAGWNVARAIAVIRPTKVSSRWLQLCFQSAPIRAEILGVLNTTVQSTLNLADLKRLRIPVPPSEIRSGIEEVLGALDDKITANTKLAAASMRLAESLYLREILSTELSMQPLGQVATTVLGGTPSRDNEDFWTSGTVPWLNSGKANEDRITKPSAFITEDALRRSAAKLMPEGTTVIAITGATLGQVSRLEIAASGNQSLVGIWSENRASNDWLYFAIRDQIPELLKKATGAAQQHVNKRDVDSLKVPIAGSKALATFSTAATPLLKVAASADIQNIGLAATRDALLPQLMSGRLPVKDAEKVLENAGV